MEDAALPSPTEAAFLHIMALLGYGQDDDLPLHPVWEALSHGGFDSLVGLFSLSRGDVSTLTYRDDIEDPPVRLPLPRGHQVALLVPQGYRQYFQKTQQRPISASDWLHVTSDQFTEYRLSADYMYFNNSDGSTGLPESPPQRRYRLR
jgi:hypothetical protein